MIFKWLKNKKEYTETYIHHKVGNIYYLALLQNDFLIPVLMSFRKIDYHEVKTQNGNYLS